MNVLGRVVSCTLLSTLLCVSICMSATSTRSSILKSLLHQVFERHGVSSSSSAPTNNSAATSPSSSRFLDLYSQRFPNVPNSSRVKSLIPEQRRVTRRSCFSRNAETISLEKDRAAVVLTGRVESVLFSGLGSETDSDGSAVHRTRRNHYDDKNNKKDESFPSRDSSTGATILEEEEEQKSLLRRGSRRVPPTFSKDKLIEKLSGSKPAVTQPNHRESFAAARIRVKRVIKGDRSLENTLVVVVVQIDDNGSSSDGGGSGSSAEYVNSGEDYGFVTDRRLCMGRLRIRDTRIFMLQIDSFGRLVLLSNPLPLTLKNLREINSHTKDSVSAKVALAPPAKPPKQEVITRISKLTFNTTTRAYNGAIVSAHVTSPGELINQVSCMWNKKLLLREC